MVLSCSFYCLIFWITQLQYLSAVFVSLDTLDKVEDWSHPFGKLTWYTNQYIVCINGLVYAVCYHL